MTRYYYYIADSKVDMLLPQIPGALKREISAELGFDIKILKGSIGERRTTLDDRISRVEAVERYLTRGGKVGPDVGSLWFGGTMAGTPLVLEDCSGAVFFFGRFYGSSVLLGGSERHLIGGEDLTTVGPSYSFLPRLVGALMSTLHQEEKRIVLSMTHEVKLRASVGPDFDSGRAWRDVMGLLNNKRKMLRDEPLDFIARRLVVEQVQETPFALATPLFVASPS